MTGLLNDLMRDRADHLEAPEVDLAAIARDGERAVRRRRAAVVGGVAAASVVAVVSGAALLGTRGGDDGQVAGSPPAGAQPLTWTTGRTLHTAGGESVDLAAEVRAWVWVGDDVVYTDPGHRVHLWQDGRDQVVGETMRAGHRPRRARVRRHVRRLGRGRPTGRALRRDRRGHRPGAGPPR